MINGGPNGDSTVNGFVPGDEEAYQLWLRSPSAPVGHILHIGYNGDSAVYPNWVNYTLKLSDFPFAGYREVIRTIASFTRQISADLSGEVTTSIGEFVFDNTDGSLDSWPRLAIDGQPVRVYHGDPSWPAERFRLIFECIAEGFVGATLDSLTLRVRGIEHGANLPIQTNLIPASVVTNAQSNMPVPLAYGQVFNVKPAIIDDATGTRQWNDGAVTEVTDGRDSGIPFRTNPIAISAVDTGADVISTPTEHGFYPYTRVRCETLDPLPTGHARWSNAAWNGSVLCAVPLGRSAIAATSSDGITWIERALPVAANWVAVAWNGSLFCAVAEGTIAATSPDGIVWTHRTMPANMAWTDIASDGSGFVAISSDPDPNNAATSPDGISWTARSMPSSISGWHALAWNGTVFCAVAFSTNQAATSPDGITWTARTLPSSGFWSSIDWNGTVFCAIRQFVTNAATSPDGITWTARSLPSASWWNSIRWNGTNFLAIANDTSTDAATSPDGITWTARTLPASKNWNGIGVAGTVFVALADSASVARSTDNGVTLSAVTLALPSPLAIDTDYWAHPLSETDFKLTATREGTVPVNLTSSATGAMLVGFHWTPDLTNGKVYLDSKPAGDFTLDGVAGEAVAAEILPVVLNAINVDADSKARFAVTCPQTIGIFVGERRNRLDVAKDIMSGLGAWYGYNRYSLLKMGRIESSYTAHDFEVIEDQMDDESFVIERLIPPAKLHRIGYRKNWTNQSGQLADGVTAEERGLYSSDYSSSEPVLGADEGPAGEELHLLAIKPDVIESMMANGGEAATEAARRNEMFYGWGAIFRCTVGRIGAEMDPGDVVKVRHWRYGCAAGVRMALVYVEDRPSDRSTVLKFFAALPNYTPGQL